MGGEIRIGVGRCLFIFAMFGLLFGIPAAAMSTIAGVQSPITVTSVVIWCVGQAGVASLISRSGRRARERFAAPQLNVAIERAIRTAHR